MTNACATRQHGETAKQTRARILQHATTRQTDAGPQYVACSCDRCNADRRALDSIFLTHNQIIAKCLPE